MKRTLAIIGIWAVLLAAWPAFSQQGPQGHHGRRGDRTGPAGQALGQPLGQPQGRLLPPVRKAGHAGPRQPMERMTAEDRRQLRQDVRQHGREVYRDRREEEKQ